MQHKLSAAGIYLYYYFCGKMEQWSVNNQRIERLCMMQGFSVCAFKKIYAGKLRDTTVPKEVKGVEGRSFGNGLLLR